MVRYKCKHCEKNFRHRPKKYHSLGQCINAVKKDLKIKCENCTFLSDNKDILKLHALCHQISVEDIMKKLPLSIKEASFKTEDEFQTDVKNFFNNSLPINSEDEPLAYGAGLLVECTEQNVVKKYPQ